MDRIKTVSKYLCMGTVLFITYKLQPKFWHVDKVDYVTEIAIRNKV